MLSWLKPTKERATFIVIELVLIVIGVLIAITVENQRQSLGDRNKEQTSLEALKVAVQADTAMLNQEIQKCFLKQKASRRILDLVNDRGEVTNRQFEELIQHIMVGIDPFYSSATYEDLRASGSLQLIRDEGLRQSIVRYYLIVNQQSSIMSSRRDFISYNPIFTGLLTYDEYTLSRIDNEKILKRLRENPAALNYLENLEKASYTAHSALLFTSLPLSLDLLEQLEAAIVNQ